MMNLPISISALLVAYVIVIIGAAIQGSVGFGLGSFAVPLLLLIDPIFVPGPLLFLAFFLTVMLYGRERKAVKFKEVKWAIVGRFIGTAIGAFLLAYIPQAYTGPLIAVLVLIALLFIVGGYRLPLTTPNIISIASLSGFMGTVGAIGGPPLALLYYDQEGARIRGTLSAIFIVGTVVAVASLALIDRFGLDELVVSISLIPALLIGFLVSKFSARILDAGYLQRAILVVSGSAAVFIIVRHFIQN
ncbi:MAG: sulfite exporter TauE/SafE family protein [Rhodothermia bacterium]|nr:MAG: sulfite exporter TauE/SafE family protein [Rhodothermia bacterium]